jgi:hypothetical protein
VRLKRLEFASLLQIDHWAIILLQRGTHVLRLHIIKIFSFTISYSFQSKVNTAQSTLLFSSAVSHGASLAPDLPRLSAVAERMDTFYRSHVSRGKGKASFISGSIRLDIRKPDEHQTQHSHRAKAKALLTRSLDE